MALGNARPKGSVAEEENTGVPVLAGSIAGIAAWLMGYALTYVIVGRDIRETVVHQVVEAFNGESSTYEMVGWVFYNAHFVNTTFENIPIFGSYSITYIGGENGLSILFYLLPVVILLAAGFGLARYFRANDPTRGAMVGLTVIPGYLVLAIAGVFIFEVTLGGMSGSPDRVPAILMVGIVYPTIFAGGGGALAGLLKRRKENRVERAQVG